MIHYKTINSFHNLLFSFYLAGVFLTQKPQVLGQRFAILESCAHFPFFKNLQCFILSVHRHSSNALYRNHKCLDIGLPFLGLVHHIFFFIRNLQCVILSIHRHSPHDFEQSLFIDSLSQPTFNRSVAQSHLSSLQGLLSPSTLTIVISSTAANAFAIAITTNEASTGGKITNRLQKQVCSKPLIS